MRENLVFLLLVHSAITYQVKISDSHLNPMDHLLQQFILSVSDCELFHVSLMDGEPFQLNVPQLSQSSSGAFQVFSFANITFRRHQDIHRYTKQFASIAIFCLDTFSEKISAWAMTTLFPTFGSIMRKDEDYFVFITHPRDQLPSKILLSDTLGQKLKYAAVLVPSTQEVFNVQLFGNPQGKPDLKSFKVSAQEEQPDTHLELFREFPSQLNGKVFRFSVPKSPFRFEIRQFPDGKYYPVRGLYVWYYEAITKKFNFSSDMFYSSFGGGTGKQFANGSWAGSLGDVLNGKADISVMVGLVHSRYKHISWSFPLTYEWLVFITPSPQTSYSPMSIFWPFEKETWIMFWTALAMAVVGFYFIGQFRGYDKTVEKVKWTVGSSVEYIYGSFLEQDANCPSNTQALRILCVFWLLFALVTSTAYRGKLVSLIAFPVKTWIPSTFVELANSDFKVALYVMGKKAGGAASAWISTNKNPVINRLARRVEYAGEVLGNGASQGETCLRRAINDNYVCVVWKGIGDYAKAKNLTDRFGHVPLVESPETAMFVEDGWNYEKRATFGHIFDTSVRAAVQMGLPLKWLDMDQYFVHKERIEWSQQTNQTETVYTQDEGPQELILAQFIGVFLVYFGGILLASLQFTREKMPLLCKFRK